MKKLLLLALTALMMAGCDIRTEETKRGNLQTGKSWSEIVKENRRIRDSIEQKWHGFEVVVIDSCEYLLKEYYGYKAASISMVHKGNCKFCKERRQKELEELIIKLKEK